MPAHTAQPGSSTHRPARLATWAAAAVIALLAAACTSTASTSSPDTAASVVAAASPGGHVPTLTGAGSTFDAPFFSVAFAPYQQQHPGVTIGYSAVGSSAGITAFSAGQVDFGASDVPMTAPSKLPPRAGRSPRCPSPWAAKAWSTTCPSRPVPAAPDRPGPRGDLPRADHPLDRPGRHRAQPGRVPSARADQ